MEKIKKIIIVLIVILIIIGIVVAILFNSQTTDEQQETNNIIQTTEINGFSEVNDYTTYYTVKEIINNYINYMKQINGDQYIDTSKLNMTEEEITFEMQSSGMNAIKGILDMWYSNNLAAEAEYIDGNAGFCGDRRVSSGTGEGTI